jgi:hypothetical protein
MTGIKNRTLIIAFLGLALILLLTKIFRSTARSSNLDTSSFQIDTTHITEIRLVPQKDSMIETKLVRTANQWNAIRKNVQVQVPHSKIKNVLTVLKDLRPERVISRKKVKWAEYQLLDTIATSVTILGKDKTLLELKVGKTSGNTTYARTTDKEEVYALGGDLQSSFNIPFKEWRNQTFIRLTKNTINKIEFHYPDSSFTIEKKNKKWLIGDKPADSVKVDAYLSKIDHKDFDSFADHFSPATEPDATLIFKTDTNQEFSVKGWKHSLDQWMLNSTLQPQVYFLDTGAVMAKNIFPSKKEFENN